MIGTTVINQYHLGFLDWVLTTLEMIRFLCWAGNGYPIVRKSKVYSSELSEYGIDFWIREKFSFVCVCMKDPDHLDLEYDHCMFLAEDPDPE